MLDRISAVEFGIFVLQLLLALLLLKYVATWLAQRSDGQSTLSQALLFIL